MCENKCKKLLTADELAELFQVGKRTIYRWRTEGLPCITHRPLRFDFEAVKNWLEERYERERGIQETDTEDTMRGQ